MENFAEHIVQNLRKIMTDKGLKQAAMADFAGITASQYSKVMSGSVQLSLQQLSNLATNLGMREIDIITYPERFVSDTAIQQEPLEAVLQIRLKKDKQDQVLRLVFGDNNVEILNK